MSTLKDYVAIHVNIDRYVGGCNVFNDVFNKVSLPKNRRFKSKRFLHDYRNKWIKNIRKTYIIEMWI